jgi:hypothetical protein
VIVIARKRLSFGVYDSSRGLTTDTHSTWRQGSLPGVLLELNKLAAFTRVDSENHALLTMAGLTAVEPHRVRVFHSELGSREGFLVFCDWHTDRTN